MTSDSPESTPDSLERAPASPYNWRHKLRALLLIVLCFELGVFLLVFPWLQAWDVNWFASYSPALRELWVNGYFRGALSGLGLVNIYISLAEVARLRRFSS